MDKKIFKLLILLLVIVLISGCIYRSELNLPAKTLSDLQITACNTAQEAGTCNTRLEEIGLVIPEDCCEVLGKCCR